MKNWLWWRQNWNGAYVIACWSAKSTERRAVTRRKKKSEKTLTPSGRLKNVFSGRQIWCCSRRDAWSSPHAHATGDREDNVGWSGETQEKSHPRASILFSIESGSNRLTKKKKTWTIWRAVLRLKLKKTLSVAGKMKKYRHVIIGNMQCAVVTSLENRCSLPMSTRWWWEQPQLEVENKAIKDKLLF